MAKTDIEFVQIDTNEDANSVRDRLSFLRGKRVLLIWPEEGTALNRKLDLILIQREAMRRTIRLAIVTHDIKVMDHARELNISTFETIGASERRRWKRGRSRVFTNRLHRPKGEPSPEDLQDFASRLQLKKAASNLQSALARILLLGMLAGVVFAVAYVLVPSATITLTPAQQVVNAERFITINTDPSFINTDFDNAILPAIRLQIEVEDSVTVSTTGQIDLGEAPAVGTVIFINQTGQTINIAEGTVVSTSAGTPIQFQTTQSATLSAGDGQQVEVPIEALPRFDGSVGNIEVNLINTIVGPLENSMTVRNLLPTTGGQQRVEQIVSADDVELALGYVNQQLQNRAFTEMPNLPGVNDTTFVIIETLNIPPELERNDWITLSADIDDAVPSLTVSKRAIVEAIAFDERLAQQIVFLDMTSQIRRGREIRPDSLDYTSGPIAIDGDLITFTLAGRGLVEGQVDVGQLQNQLAGRTLEDAMDYLLNKVDRATNTPPQIEMTPDWLGRLPILPIRINIVLGTSS